MIKKNRTLILSTVSVLLFAVAPGLQAAPTTEMACYKIVKKAEQSIKKAREKAALKDCAISAKFDEDVEECVENGGDLGECEDLVDLIYEPQWTQNTIKYERAHNNAVVKAQQGLNRVTAGGGSCDPNLDHLPDTFVDLIDAGKDLDKAVEECNGQND